MLQIVASLIDDARVVIYSFIVLATVITIVNYAHHLVIVQATADLLTNTSTKQFFYKPTHILNN